MLNALLQRSRAPDQLALPETLRLHVAAREVAEVLLVDVDGRLVDVARRRVTRAAVGSRSGPSHASVHLLSLQSRLPMQDARSRREGGAEDAHREPAASSSKEPQWCRAVTFCHRRRA